MAKRKATKPKPAGLSAQQQVFELDHLRQGAAAYVVGCSVRSMRDRVTVPRAPDGTYRIHDLLHAAGGSSGDPLPDRASELIARAGFSVGCCVWQPRTAGPILAAVGELVDSHGDAALLALGRAVFDELAAQPRPEIVDDRPTDDHDRIGDDLRAAVQCPHCDRIRNGPSWIKRAIPGDVAAMSEPCPDCAGRPKKTNARRRA